ncbi:MAG: AAA family ATPase [Actinobacteria bacterium]|nr:AAA family ATPase [Actinomycetota bacterium]
MSHVIAVAGKGGTGKTTICAMTMRFLIENRKTPILALDADPNSNLNELLGIEVKNTVGSVREDIRNSYGKIPSGMTKKSYMELKLQESLVEQVGFDLLVMGRPEGQGCYCYANSLFREYADVLVANYRYVVMDNEAGLEHLSRMTTQDVDTFMIISDASIRGIQAAIRVKELSSDLKLRMGRTYLIINRADDARAIELYSTYVRDELELAGVIPSDEAIFEMDFRGQNIFDLPADSIALKRVFDIIGKILGIPE